MKKALLVIATSIGLISNAQSPSCNRIVLSDNFSAPSNWTAIGSGGVTVSGGTCNFSNVYDGSYNKVYQNLGTTLSDTYWKAECKFSILSPNPSGNGVGEILMALTAGNLDFMSYDASASYTETNQDGIAVVINSNSTSDNNTNDWYFLIEGKKGNVRTYNLSSLIYANSSINNYYLRLERTAKGMTQLSVFSDSLYTSPLPGSPVTFGIDSTITGLNTVQHGTSTPGYYTRFINATIDNDLICDANNPVPVCSSSFTYTLGTSGQVSFTNNSSGSYNTWNFGDGSTSNVLNPTHTYANNGTYTVEESVTDSVGNVLCTSTQTLAITNISCNTPAPSVSYTIIADSIPHWWDLYINYSPSVVNAVWYWGDGTSSTGFYPIHAYVSAGMYNICVTVFNICGDSSSFCNNDSIYRLGNYNNASNLITHVDIKQADQTTGINKLASNDHQVYLYPNPSNGTFTIDPNNTTQQILRLMDINGRVVLSQSINGKTLIDATSLNAGIYNLNILSDGISINKRLIITK